MIIDHFTNILCQVHQWEKNKYFTGKRSLIAIASKNQNYENNFHSEESLSRSIFEYPM